MPSISRLDFMGLLPSGFWSAMDSFVQWAADLGLPGLAILSFTEAFVQPVPPEALTLPMSIAEQGNPLMILLIWLVVKCPNLLVHMRMSGVLIFHIGMM